MWPRYFSNKDIHQGPQILKYSFSSVFVGLIQLRIQNLKNMNAVVFHSRWVNFPPFCSFSRKLKLGRPFYSLKDGPLPFPSKKDGLQLSVSSTKSDGSRRSRPTRKGSAPGRARKEDKREKYQFSGGKLPKSPNQEEILALFRRIQSTISKGEAKNTKQTNLSPAESILKVLHKSKKPIKDRTTKSEGDEVSVPKQGVLQKDHKTQNDGDHSASNFNLTRPPSNFVRRSPIPSPSSPRGNTITSNSDPSKTSEDNEIFMLPRIEEMKLPELKELAKTRGFKGYSKLKKRELLELLRS